MRQFLIASALVLAACSSTPEEPPANVLAIQDYIAVAELPEVKRFRTDLNASVGTLDNPRFVLLNTRRQSYLIEFTRDCLELMGSNRVTPDVRREGDHLRAGRDTIRGCRIKRAFEVNEGQVQELESLGDAPTGG